MCSSQRKPQMEAVSFKHEGKDVTLGVLRSPLKNPALLMDAPVAVAQTNESSGLHLRLAHHELLVHALSNSNLHYNLSEGIPSPSSTALAFEASGRPKVKLGRQITFMREGEFRVVFPSGKYCGESGIALAAFNIAAKDIALEKSIRSGKPAITDAVFFRNFSEKELENRLLPIPDFTQESGWYFPYKDTGIPSGRKAQPSNSARHIVRAETAYAGLMVLGVPEYSNEYGRYLFANQLPSDPVGIVVEIPQEDAGKIEFLPALTRSRDSQPPRRNPSAVIEFAEDSISPSVLREVILGFAGELGALEGTVREGLLTNAKALEKLLRKAKIREE